MVDVPGAGQVGQQAAEPVARLGCGELADLRSEIAPAREWPRAGAAVVDRRHLPEFHLAAWCPQPPGPLRCSGTDIGPEDQIGADVGMRGPTLPLGR